MTYGSPASLEPADVRTYLGRIRGGREPDDDLVAEFTRRYRAIGGSPLIEITGRQGEALEALLGWPVAIGMRFSEPSIAMGLSQLVDRGVIRVAGIVLSPQYSPLLMDGYRRAADEARTSLEERAPDVVMAERWHDEPAFLDAVAERIREARDRFPPNQRRSVPVLLTAHSLPQRVAEQEPGYVDQLRETAEAVAERAGLAREGWRFCWQSAGHAPGAWMTPDFVDLMPELAAAGHRSVLVAPIQFLADHLEVLYDVDIGAREQAERAGLRLERIESLNVHPRFIQALAAVARRTLSVDSAELMISSRRDRSSP
jgi:ferrochelatase